MLFLELSFLTFVTHTLHQSLPMLTCIFDSDLLWSQKNKQTLRAAVTKPLQPQLNIIENVSSHFDLDASNLNWKIVFLLSSLHRFIVMFVNRMKTHFSQVQLNAKLWVFTFHRTFVDSVSFFFLLFCVQRVIIILFIRAIKATKS